jgi:hypothetical protein
MKLARRTITPIFAAFALALATAPADAAHQLVQSVRSGKAAVIAYNWYFVQGAPACVPGPRPSVTIVSPPSFGAIRILRGAGTVFEQSNQCYGRRSQSIGIVYMPRRGFVGTDGFEVIWIFPNGHRQRSTYRFPVQ